MAVLPVLLVKAEHSFQAPRAHRRHCPALHRELKIKPSRKEEHEASTSSPAGKASLSALTSSDSQAHVAVSTEPDLNTKLLSTPSIAGLDSANRVVSGSAPNCEVDTEQSLHFSAPWSGQLHCKLIGRSSFRLLVVSIKSPTAIALDLLWSRSGLDGVAVDSLLNYYLNQAKTSARHH